MKLLVFRALWGMTGPLEAQVAQIAAAGYDGVEGAPPNPADMTPAAFLALLERHHLQFIAGAFVTDKADLAPTLNRLAEYAPLKIDLHSGQDSMTRDEGSAFFEEALRVEATLGVPVGHETHRGRAFFTPWDTAYYLRQFDTLKIVADYSHWVNVCERLPDDQADALALANARAIHIHGRVGYEEGPQVPDPRRAGVCAPPGVARGAVGVDPRAPHGGRRGYPDLHAGVRPAVVPAHAAAYQRPGGRPLAGVPVGRGARAATARLMRTGLGAPGVMPRCE
ncbi:MAG: hypothetical protein M5R40_14100 [Anaerolineae bacterium]|nr:hypothetical protein [Anaerolineae bacterium]